MESREIVGPGGVPTVDREAIEKAAALERYRRKVLTMCHFGDSLAQLGTDERIKVGCVVFPLDCSAVLGIGYNGPAAGLPHVVPDREIGRSPSGCAHAEMNALMKMDLRSAPPCIMYCNVQPCSYCAPHIVNSGTVVGVICKPHPMVKPEYDGVPILRAAGVWVVDLDEIGNRSSEEGARFLAHWRSQR